LREALRRLVVTGAMSLPNVAPPKEVSGIAQFPEALRAAMRCLGAAGIEVFLTAGTLLGAIRDGDFIGFDKDIDLGVSAKVPMERIARALSADPDFEGNWAPGRDGILYCWCWRQSVAIDFFRFYEEGDTVWYGLYRHGRLIKWVHRPFGLTDFTWHGMKTRIPENSEFFLEEVYGPGWRIPDPDCGQWACPNIEGGFPSVCRHAALADIFMALWKCQIKRARHLCLQALELDPDDAFFRQLLTEFEAIRPQGGESRVRSETEFAVLDRLGQAAEEDVG
jgi:hypothetical protein